MRILNVDDHEYIEYDDETDLCMTCQGEGVEECEDTDSAEGCWAPDCNGFIHTCPNCLGSGNAKDQRYW